ncbi:MAG: hypothetical protein ACIAQ0_01620 [Phycisphaerales bacterium JB058]
MLLDGGGGPLTTGQFIFLAIILYGPTLVCTAIYLAISRFSRMKAGRKIELADHFNLLYALIFTIAAPFLVLYSLRSAITHAIVVVLIPGLVSSAILAWRWHDLRPAKILAITTLTIAAASVLIDPRLFIGPISPELSVGIFLLEPIAWLIGYANLSNLAANRSLARSTLTIPTHCQECGYSVAGLPSSICPECGHDFSQPSLKA